MIPLIFVFPSEEERAFSIGLSLLRTPELSKAINIICCFTVYSVDKNGFASISSFLNTSNKATLLDASSRPCIVSNVDNRVDSNCSPLISPSLNIPAAEFDVSVINVVNSERDFLVSLVIFITFGVSPNNEPKKPLKNFWLPVGLIVKSLLNLTSSFATWSCNPLIDSGEKLSDLTSSFTSVLPASSRRASIIVWTCSSAKPCALRLRANEVNANCASSAVDSDNVLIVGANCFLNDSSALSLSLALLVSFATISLFLFSNGSFVGTTPKKSPNVLTCSVVVFIAFERPLI